MWGSMDPLELVGMPGLMALTHGRGDVVVGLVDGPVALDHPDLETGKIRTLPGTPGACRDPGSEACRHGTFVAGILAARRGGHAPAIAPGCTLLVRPVFSEAGPARGLPSATPGQLAEAIVDCVEAGAWILNLSAALTERWRPTQLPGGPTLLRAGPRRGVLPVRAAQRPVSVTAPQAPGGSADTVGKDGTK
jgi:subtilisin family serine protease